MARYNRAAESEGGGTRLPVSISASIGISEYLNLYFFSLCFFFFFLRRWLFLFIYESV